jgi:UDP-N-acetylmuramyl pentapeptide synthase
VDPIDWIESIPFPETRNYVERVLENLEVYRNRVSNSDQKLGIIADLYRANPTGMTAVRQANSVRAGIRNADAVVGAAASVSGASGAQ